jgi:hypothetical protein
MDDVVANLHNAARVYCVTRIKHWHERYAELGRARRDRVFKVDGPWTYSDDAYDTFPRYNALGAILHEIEQFVPADFASADMLRELLAAAADTARTPSIAKPSTPIEAAAIEDERRQFAAFIRTLEPADAARHAPLPFRRVLGDREHTRLHDQFAKAWGNWYGGCVDRKDLPPHVTLHTAAMDVAGAYDWLRDALRERGIGRVLELREYDWGCELDLDATSFTYNGAEGFWTSGDMSWMVQASHESSITFGGAWLVDAMRAALPEFERWVYKGWDETAY